MITEVHFVNDEFKSNIDISAMNYVKNDFYFILLNKFCTTNQNITKLRLDEFDDEIMFTTLPESIGNLTFLTDLVFILMKYQLYLN